ncbi:PREDICTED: oligoribonuclease, mitochondrial [Galeopterus variegatus]|uniref:Oligoribonuclease, mitochondrial n=1 Tax=Galeopterus variegatus TaxID=482537 RepID=A0ABM0R611_GALVR|nr:PREDICTED: oligoribonuclease, mitochondrial [Galeopterus variegatus]
MLGGSLGFRLLRGVVGSRGQFGARGIREGGAAMAAGESMAQRMVWVDLEMTGLDIEKDQIIEMACLITDSDLNILAEVGDCGNAINNQEHNFLDLDSLRKNWCKDGSFNLNLSSKNGPSMVIFTMLEVKFHFWMPLKTDFMCFWWGAGDSLLQSGLTKAVKESTITLQQAEYEFLSFVRQQTPPGLCPLAGNSVHADKKFLDKYMPQFMKHLHYRIIDVSTVKELCRRWYPEEYEFAPKKAASHRALDDISESIKELQFYRNNIFKKKTDEKKRKIIENGENEKTVS